METILLPDFTFKRSVSVASIEYVEAVGNYSLIHRKNQKPMLVALTLKRLSERLPTFLRIHKGTLVNPAYIVAYHTRYLDAPFVQLSQNRKLSIRVGRSSNYDLAWLIFRSSHQLAAKQFVPDFRSFLKKNPVVMTDM